MNEAVLTAYGWSALDPKCDFYQTKEGERFTIADESRREMIRRMIALNNHRRSEEMQHGPPAVPKGSKAHRRGRKGPDSEDQLSPLFS